MKINYLKTAFIILAMLSISTAYTQENTYQMDTVNMQAGRTHDVFYSLQNGTSATVVRDNWHMQFSTLVMDVTIRINAAEGVRLYTYPYDDTSGWETVDTVGMEFWPEMYNDDKDWEVGAFNRNVNSTNVFDLGWGVYNMQTHTITGDSLFVLKLPDGNVKKLWIVKKVPVDNQYTFKYANLDGSGETELVLACNDYADKNFVGYSFYEDAFVDREPPAETWDLLFSKYTTFYQQELWYPVTGILQNYGVQVAEYREVDTTFMDYTIAALDSFNISTVGNYWYELVGGMPPSYVVTDSLVYFVSDRESNIWKLVFEGYNSGEGKIGFRKMLVGSQSGIAPATNSKKGNLAIHPNPATSTSTSLMFNATQPGKAELQIFNISGQMVSSKKIVFDTGLNDRTLDISNLPSGAYMVMLKANNTTLTNKLIVR